MRAIDGPAPVLRERLEREVDLIESAMRLVASGASPRTTVVGLRLTEAAVTIAAHRLGDLGVEVDTLQRPGRSGLDVVAHLPRPQPVP